MRSLLAIGAVKARRKNFPAQGPDIFITYCCVFIWWLRALVLVNQTLIFDLPIFPPSRELFELGCGRTPFYRQFANLRMQYRDCGCADSRFFGYSLLQILRWHCPTTSFPMRDLLGVHFILRCQFSPSTLRTHCCQHHLGLKLGCKVLPRFFHGSATCCKLYCTVYW